MQREGKGGKGMKRRDEEKEEGDKLVRGDQKG